MAPIWYVTFFFEAGDAQSINCTEEAARQAEDEWINAMGQSFEESKTIITVKGCDDTPARAFLQISIIAENVRYVQLGRY
jgi:hypothetical protein